MTGIIATIPQFQFNGVTGLALAGGTLTTYLAGTTTLEPTYQDQALTITNTNPIVLDSSGGCAIWLNDQKRYKFVLKNAFGVVRWTQDNINGATSLDQLLASSGSSLVGFIQAGTGAVTRTAQSKMRETVSVKDFGAVGDGTTDDTAAILAAVAYVSTASPKKRLYFPTGRYRTTSMVSFDYPGVHVYGDGRYASTIYFTGSGQAVQFTDANPNNGTFAYGGCIEDLCIEGNASSTTLLRIKFVNHFKANNINLKESSPTIGVGLQILGTVCGHFSGIVCSTNAQLMSSRPQNGIVVDRDPTTLTRATDNTFDNCIVEGMLGDGIQLINSDQSFFIGGTSENNDGNGITISAGSRMNTLTSVAFENTVGFADIYDNGFSNIFLNCYSKKLIYVDTASLFSTVKGGFHQSITVAGDFATVQDLKYSFFGPGGLVTVSTKTSTRNLFNDNTSALTYAVKAPVVVTVGASPFTYTNTTGQDLEVIVSGGTVTQIVFNRFGGVTTLPISGMYRLAPSDSLSISYTVLPTVVAIPFGSNYI